MPGPNERATLARDSAFSRGNQVLNRARSKHAQDERARREQAAFMASWREARAESMQPRDVHLPTASDRLAALRSRLEARGIVSTPA